MSIDEVIAKILKIRALADRGGTQAEMEAAAEMAQKLMLAHGIEEAHLAIDRGEPVTGYGYRTFVAGSEQWRIVLLDGIARGNGCRTVLGRPTGSRTRGGGQQRGRKHVTEYDVFGHRDSVRFVVELYNELSLAFETMSDREYCRAAVYTDTHKRTWRNSWKLGAAQEIARRFRAQVLKTKHESAYNSTALVVIENQTDVTVDKVYPKLGPARRAGKVTVDYDAMRAGKAAASGMGLAPTPKLGGTAGNRLG
jgi:hypothetical protein